MICDAHIHVGYYSRKRYAEPFYYSPRRICTVLKKCGVEEFIYSSTSMQTHGINFDDVNKEMWEVQNIFGKGAHPFLWVTKRYHFTSPGISDLGFGFYEGVKLHGMDGSYWITKNADALEDVLSSAERHDKPVIIHTGSEEDSCPLNYLPFILKHPRVRFNLAHGRPRNETEECMKSAPNVFADVSFMDPDDILKFAEDGWADRLLWGTDFPALMTYTDGSPTKTMRMYISFCNQLSEKIDFTANFHKYLNGVG